MRQKDKKLKDLVIQVEDERKQSEQYKDQVCTLHTHTYTFMHGNTHRHTLTVCITLCAVHIQIIWRLIFFHKFVKYNCSGAEGDYRYSSIFNEDLKWGWGGGELVESAPGEMGGSVVGLTVSGWVSE